MRPLALILALFAVASAVRGNDRGQVISLFNGKDFSGWDYIAPDKSATLTSVSRYLANGVVAISGKPTSYLQTTEVYKNFRLHAEWRWPEKPGNGGVLLHIASGPIDRNTWPLCIQLQTKFKSVGDLLPMAGAKFSEPLTSEPTAATPVRVHQAPDSEKAAGEWNSCDIVCREGVIDLSINGVAQNKISGCKPASGHVGFQLEGIAFELRNVTIEPLKADVGISRRDDPDSIPGKIFRPIDQSR